MGSAQSLGDGLFEHNPACSKARCAACLGYGVIVLHGGPTYRACHGEADERRMVAMEIDRLSNELYELPRWPPLRYLRRRRELRKHGKQWMDRHAAIGEVMDLRRNDRWV